LCVQVWIKGSLDLIERRKKDTSTSTWAKGIAGSSSCHSSIDDPCDETDDVLSKFVPAGQTVAPTFFLKRGKTRPQTSATMNETKPPTP
jgi:hypothetical protein